MRNKKATFVMIFLIFSVLISAINISLLSNIKIEEITDLKLADDGYEENDILLAAKLISDTYYNTSLNCSDDDWYRIDIPNDRSIIVQIYFNSTKGNLDLGLYDSGMTLLDLSNSVTDFERVEYYFITAGSYYINVSYIGSPNDNYSLSVQSYNGNIFNSITVNNPNSGTIWSIGSNYAIDWTSTGIITKVSIRLWAESLSYNELIVFNTPNDGHHDYLVHNGISPGFYFIEVRDSSGTAGYNTSNFQIISPVPTIQITNPTESTVWIKPSSYSLTWAFTGSIANVEIRLYRYECPIMYGGDGDDDPHHDTEYLKISGISNDGNEPIDVSSGWPSGNYYFIIKDYVSGAEAISKLFAIINNGEISSISISAPSINEKLSQKSEYYIQWNWTGPITHVDIELWNGSTNKIRDIANDIKNCGNFKWLVPLTVAAGNTYAIKVYASNERVIYDEIYPFTIERAMQIPGYPFLIVLGCSLIAIVGLIYYQSKKRKIIM